MKKNTLFIVISCVVFFSCSSVPPTNDQAVSGTKQTVSEAGQTVAETRQPVAMNRNAAGTKQPAEAKTPLSPVDVLRERVSSYPFDLEVCDLDGDGLKDLLIMSHGGNELDVYKNMGNRKFECVQKVKEVGFHPNGVRAYDQNGDGRADVVLVSCEGKHTYQVYSVGSDGKLSFVSEHPVGITVYSMEIADLDGNGNIDAVMGTGPGGIAHEVVVVYGATTSEPKITVLKTSHWRTLYPKIGDVNNDGKPDIVVMNADTSRLSIFINKGDRNFEQKLISTPKGVAREVELADLNRDGTLDYLLPYEVGKIALIIYNDGTGMEKSRETIAAPSFGLRYGNVYMDAEKTLIGFGEEKRVFFTMKKVGDTSWSPLKEVKAGGKPWRFRFEDLDKDGKLDVVFLNSVDDEFQVIWDVMSLFKQ